MHLKNLNSHHLVNFFVSLVAILSYTAGHISVARADEPAYNVYDIGAVVVSNSYSYTCGGRGVYLNNSGMALYASQGRGLIFQPTAGSRDVGAFYDPDNNSTFNPVGIDDNGNVTGVSTHFSPVYQNVIEYMPVYIPDHGTPQSIDLNLPGYDPVQNHNRAAPYSSSQDGKHYVGTVAQLNGDR